MTMQTDVGQAGKGRTVDRVEAITNSPDWHIEVNEKRPRPPGAASTHHVDDIVLRARRVGPKSS